MSKASIEPKKGGAAEVASEMSTPQKPVLGGLSDFLQDNPAVKDPGKPLELQPEGKDAALKRQREIEKEHQGDDDEPIEEEEGGVKKKPVAKPPVAKVEPEPKKKGFLKSTIQSEKEARAELERVTAELEGYKTKQIPELTKQIKDLTEKANAATNQVEFDRIKGELEIAQREREELKGKFEQTQTTLSFYDLQQKPEFKQDFVVPVQRNRESLNKVVAGNADLEAALDRAVSAHAAAMQTAKPEDRARHEAARDSIFREIYGHLHEMDRGKFDLAANRWMESTELLTRALLDHQQVARKYQESEVTRRNEGNRIVREKWMNALDETGKSFKDYETLPEEERAIAEELGEDFDITEDTALARDLIDPEKSVNEAAATRLLNQGRVYKVVQAKNKVLEKRLNDALALLARYRRSSGNKNDTTTTIVPDTPLEKSEAFSGFLKNFQPR